MPRRRKPQSRKLPQNLPFSPYITSARVFERSRCLFVPKFVEVYGLFSLHISRYAVANANNRRLLHITLIAIHYLQQLEQNNRRANFT